MRTVHASKEHFLCVPESRNRVASDSSVVMRGGGEGLLSPQSRVSLSFTFSVRSFCVSSFSSGYGDMMLRHFPSKVCVYIGLGVSDLDRCIFSYPAALSTFLRERAV